ncbi:MAG: ComF family protein [Halioglobus sp.]|nr:ComF family protein [Halioglobus sp.]
MVNSLGNRLLNGLFPQCCALCGFASDSHLPLCAGCKADLALNTHACLRCAIPLPPMAGPDAEARTCGTCLQQPPAFARAIAPWIYEEHLAHLIQRWKYRSERWLTPLLSSLLAESGASPHNVDLLVPVPMHWRRRWHRGYNQSELLAHQLLRNSPGFAHARVDTALTRRNRATRAQSGMRAGERRANLRGAFTVMRPCDNLRIAIVDDVLTTGATAATIATEIAAAGAARIELWCLARTPAPGL